MYKINMKHSRAESINLLYYCQLGRGLVAQRFDISRVEGKGVLVAGGMFAIPSVITILFELLSLFIECKTYMGVYGAS